MRMTKRELLAAASVAAGAAVAMGATTAADASALPAGMLKGLPDISAVIEFEGNRFSPVLTPEQETRGTLPSLPHVIRHRLIDAELDGLDVVGVHLSRDAYKRLVDTNLIDYIPAAEGDAMVATFLGRFVYVPGSALAKHREYPPTA